MSADALHDTNSDFDRLGLREELLETLAALGYVEPTPIQASAIPHLLEGRDLLGQAATGTGKTAAFALPILDSLADGERRKAPKALVLVPTRELAVQVCTAMENYGRKVDARITAVYGGQPIHQQLKALERGVDVVVGTPGRVMDHIGRKSLRLDSIDVVVLDEADEMLDMGFAEDIDEILSSIPNDHQNVLFSATLPPRITAIANDHLNDPVRVCIKAPKRAEGEAPKVRQTAYVVDREHKVAAMTRVLEAEDPTAAIIFCRTRDQVDSLTKTLNQRGHQAEALHGGMDQQQRDRVMGRLRNETAGVLVATDVAARGLDIDHLTHVINYDLPSQVEAYVHRIGRVGRAGRAGVALTVCEPRDRRMLETIGRVTKAPVTVAKVPSVADVRLRRSEKLSRAVQHSVAEDRLSDYEQVFSELVKDHDVTKIALAALKLADEAMNGMLDNEADIPDSTAASSLRGKSRRSERGHIGNAHKKRPSSGSMTRIFIGAGKAARVMPKDLVGAIANESRVRGNQIGSIQIQEKFSLVEIPDGMADQVIKALRNTTIKGKKATVRRERF